MAQFRFALVLALLSSFVAGSAAQAASWPSLPAACTPDRAVKWDSGKSESAQEACHCPPPSMCPTTYQEYSNPSLAKMPSRMINRCCPEIAPPTCPAGTALAGQPMPQNGECDPRCPAGSQLAGQIMPQNGDCNPTKPSACPAKYYPTLTESGLSGLTNLGAPKDPRKGRDKREANIGTFKYPDGSTYTVKSGGRMDYAAVAHLPTRYQYSLRLTSFAAQYGWAWAGDASFYRWATNGIWNDSATFYSVKSAVGPDKLTWFGFAAAIPDNLANNLISPDAVKAWGGADRYEIGQNNGMGFLTRINAPAKIEAEVGDFLGQCRQAYGEFIELNKVNVSGEQCAYVQCRYVYSDGTESCLASDVKVSLADGSSKKVSELKLGDVVKGSTGDHKVIAANTYQSSLRVLHGINGGGELLTGDHPLHTKDGWKVINPLAAEIYAKKPGFAATVLAVGDVLITDKGEVVVKSIERHAKIDPITTYNIKVEGNAGFYANGIEVKGFDKMEMKYE